MSVLIPENTDLADENDVSRGVAAADDFFGSSSDDSSSDAPQEKATENEPYVPAHVARENAIAEALRKKNELEIQQGYFIIILWWN